MSYKKLNAMWAYLSIKLCIPANPDLTFDISTDDQKGFAIPTAA